MEKWIIYRVFLERNKITHPRNGTSATWENRKPRKIGAVADGLG